MDTLAGRAGQGRRAPGVLIGRGQPLALGQNPAAPDRDAEFEALPMRWARSMKTTAAGGGQRSRAAASNKASQRSKCAPPIGSGRCIGIGWP